MTFHRIITRTILKELSEKSNEKFARNAKKSICGVFCNSGPKHKNTCGGTLILVKTAAWSEA